MIFSTPVIFCDCLSVSRTPSFAICHPQFQMLASSVVDPSTDDHERRTRRGGSDRLLYAVGLSVELKLLQVYCLIDLFSSCPLFPKERV